MVSHVIFKPFPIHSGHMKAILLRQKSFRMTISSESWKDSLHPLAIGIINLDLSDINSSVVLYPARGKDFLDWETINKLCEQNGDFAKFVEDVKIDFESKRIHKAEYDEIPKDPEKYIAEKLGIEQSG